MICHNIAHPNLPAFKYKISDIRSRNQKSNIGGRILCCRKVFVKHKSKKVGSSISFFELCVFLVLARLWSFKFGGNHEYTFSQVQHSKRKFCYEYLNTPFILCKLIFNLPFRDKDEQRYAVICFLILMWKVNKSKLLL